uniref:Choline/ethanolamine kinase n=1 Tax=Syphacia muris TaxID=451379 RepID=A0A0N5AXC2_9BILA
MTEERRCATDSAKSSCILSDDVNNLLPYDSVPYEWSVMPQSSESDVRGIFELWNSDSESARKRVVACAQALCANVLGGAWKRVSPENFRIRSITGGTSNLLFLVKLPENIKTVKHEPRNALLRIFCGTDLESRLNESVIFTILSERRIGPQLHGVFPGGRFEQFIPSRPLTTAEISYASVVVKIGQLLARIHSLDVPIIKNPGIVDLAQSYLKKLKKLNRRMKHKLVGNMVQASLDTCPAEVNPELLENELQIMRRCLEKSNSPVVFSHNDLQELNILLRDQFILDHNGNLNTTNDENPFVLIDFEYSGYNYRGFDFGNFLCEHMLNYSYNQPPYYTILPQNEPTEEHKNLFANAYLDEIEKASIELSGATVTNGSSQQQRDHKVKELLTEARRFMAVSHLFWSIWSFKLAEESPIQFDYVSYGIDRLILYYTHKKDLIEYLHSE